MKIGDLIEALERVREHAQNDEIGVAVHLKGSVMASELHGFEIAGRDLAGTPYDGLPTVFIVAGECPIEVLKGGAS